MPAPAATIFGADPRLMTSSPDIAMKALNGVLQPLNTALNPFAAFSPGFNERKPLPGETPLAYQLRMNRLNGAVALENAANSVGSEIGKLGNYVFGNEQQQQQQRQVAAPTQKPSGAVFPTSFSDPKWDVLEKQYGGDVAPLLKQIRMQGERTNMGPMGDPRYQNARTGAYTPYQITAKTRDLFMGNKNPGFRFDPWASPENAVKAAAQVLRDHGGAANPTRAVAGYFGGGNAARNPFSTEIGDGNLSVNQYVNRVLNGGQGQPGVLQNPFDPSYYQQANAQLDRGLAAEMTPTRSEFAGAPMPVMPKPEPLPKTDFSAAEANLEALRPVEMTEKEAKDAQWKNFWNGIGRAMSSSPNGEGIGSLLLRMGGGALMGKGAAAEEIQQRKDAYDVKLAKFNAALYEHNIAKAQTMHNELVADWQANQNWVTQDYQQKLGIWQNNTKVQLVGNQLVNQTIDPNSGKVVVTTTPVKSLILADDARQRAGLSMNAFGVENQANAQVAGISNRVQGQIVMGQAAQVMADEQASPGERAAAAAMAPIQTIKYIVDSGQVGRLVGGEDEMQQLNEEIMTELGGRGMQPGKEYDAAYREALVGRLLARGLQDKQFMADMMSGFGEAADLYGGYNRRMDTKEQTKTKAGNTVFTSTYDAGE